MTIRFRFLSVLLMMLAATGCATTPGSLSFNGKNSKEGLTTVERQLSMARLGERHGQSDTARKIYEKVLAEDPNNVEALHRLGVMAAKKQNYDVAISYLSKAEINDPTNIELLNDLGYALFLTDDLASAEEKLRYAVRLEPSHRAARNNLGLVLGNAGRWDECLVQFRHAVSEGEAYANLAFVQVQMGELALAEESFLSALDLDADLGAAAEGLVQIKAKKDMLEKRFIAEYESEAESQAREQLASNIEPAPISARSLPVSQARRISVVDDQPQPMIEVPVSDKPSITQVAATEVEVIAQEPIPVEVAEAPKREGQFNSTQPAVQYENLDRSGLPEPLIIERPAPRQSPFQTEKPVAVQQPATIETPVVIEEPVVIERPVAIQKPMATEKPVAVQQSATIETPATIEKHVDIERPLSFDLPKITEETVLKELPQVVRKSSPHSATGTQLQTASGSNIESALEPVQVKAVAKSNSVTSPGIIQPVVVKPVELPRVQSGNSMPIITAAQPSQPHTNIQPVTVRPVSVSPVEIREIKVAPIKVEPLSVKTPETLSPVTIMPATPQMDSSSTTILPSMTSTKPSIWD